MGVLGMLLQIALRNLFARKINLLIGSIILVGALLVVVGSAILDSVDVAMRRSITSSVAGDIHLYSSRSEEALALWGGFAGDPDISAIDNFSKVKEVLKVVPNVKTLVPMGIYSAEISTGNTVDVALSRLRDALRASKEERVEARSQAEGLKRLVRQMVNVLRADLGQAQDATDEALNPESRALLDQATSEAFWSRFDEDPFGSLEFLENRIAPLVVDADQIGIRFVGTDLSSFQKTFERMQMVDGEPVPEGRRGLLLSKFFYEYRLKLKTAWRLDRIQEAIQGNGRNIATDPELQRYVAENQAQTREILLLLDDVRMKALTQRLRWVLGRTDGDCASLLAQFLNTNDSNFAERYRIFYSDVAPLLELYRLRVGDVVTLRSFTRSGYQQSINLKFYGTFEFRGLEKSELAGTLSLMDLVSFRELYGQQGTGDAAEIADLQAAAGVKAVDRGNAEAELFGSGGSTEGGAVVGLINEDQELAKVLRTSRMDERIRQTFTRAQLEQGLVLNMAVLLKDPSRLVDTMAEIRNVAEREHLELRVISWQEASGLVGQLVSMARIGLYFGVSMLFIVALIVINNAMMMATLQRVREIGTMRAIGSQRGFILAMVLAESMFLGITFGGVGALLGGGFIGLLERVGIPATNERLYFFFAGPRLFPTLSTGHLVAGIVVVMFVTAISALYPALLATRMTPALAMVTDE